ncbi:MAG: F-type H+-transporting ATPase subunit a [Parcubacteria group bacterium Gr01-1014_48]|nr:MAG: F-type H+-transporting ATPase subunit a [Parcubacteria group bacterium Greene0416_14]TSC73483.1 MAG: F-type H+-transporting ATPase subunit a [Parcubacteria group bacterium Gr01-1014_48]TSD00550.1 MAG: F-type H+-transporting ATPase subunit a [Parcubacteria group bacterium Greene1014_15]TSD08243.1 MAG: F-type H+-transporting ATPase subunit a [Parcubacteria group bacterium Greene0714_4]
MHEISISAEELFSIGGFHVTNTLVMTWFVMAFLAIISIVFIRRLKLAPSGFQNGAEVVYEGILGLLAPMFGGREIAEKYFPFLATIFVFIITANWFGIAPLLPALGMFHEGHEGVRVFVPFFRSSASDINFTLALAFVSITAVQWFGIVALGAWKHTAKFLNFKSPIDFFIGILELFSEVSKTISFSFRLFGNVFAGEVLLMIVSFLLPYVGPIPFLFLEIFVGFIQALVFTMLTAIFIKIATAEHH